MEQNQPGVFRAALLFVKTALNENALLRTSVLATVLCITLACILLAFFGVTHTLGPKAEPGACSPRLFGLLFLPAEFLIYDLILGNPRPRAALKDLYLDWRFLRYFWALLKSFAAVFAPFASVLLLVAGLTAGFAKNDKLTPSGGLALVLGILVLTGVAFYLFSRFFYLSIVVARRDDKPVRAAFRETRGRIWRIGRALLLPYLAILAVTIPMEMLGPVLERRLGFAGLAPWFLFDAGLTGFVSCLSAAVFALSYQRIIGQRTLDQQAAGQADAGPQGNASGAAGAPEAEFALGPAPEPPGRTPDGGAN